MSNVDDTRVRGADRLPSRSPRIYPGWWVVLTCFWLAVLSWGIGFYGHGIYLTQLDRMIHGGILGRSAVVLSLATTGYYLAGGTLMLFIGTAIDRLGARIVVLVCIFALCSSLALLAIISTPWQIIPAYLLMAVGWAGTSWTAIPCILARWFDQSRGLAISIAFTGASFGGIIVPPLLVYLSNAYGFALAAGAVAAVGFAIAGTLAVLFLHAGPEIFGLPVDGMMPRGETSTKHRAANSTKDRTEPLRTLSFWTMTIAFSLALTTQVGFLTHQIPLLAPALGMQIASLAVAVTTAASICGRLALGVVIDRLDPRAVSAVAFALQALALVGLGRVTEYWAFFAACIAYGVWVGILITMPALIVQREFRPAAFAATIGLVTSISQFSFALGPGLLGFLRQMAGSYDPVLMTCAAFNLAAGVLILVPRYRWRRASARRVGRHDALRRAQTSATIPAHEQGSC